MGKSEKRDSTDFLSPITKTYTLEMGKYLINFLLLTMLLVCLGQEAKGQNVLLNKALETAYRNYLHNVPLKWKERFKRKDFYLISNYTPYGFDVHSIRGWKSWTVENDQLVKGKMHVGYSGLILIDSDTLSVKIGQVYCNQDGMYTFIDNFISFFKIHDNGFEDLHLSQKAIGEIYRIARKKRNIINLDSIYNKAIKNGIDSLIKKGILQDDIYISREYFPNWLFGSMTNPLSSSIEGNTYKEFLSKGYYIIGWPLVAIKEGHIEVTFYCSNKVLEGRRVVSRVQYTYDKEKRQWLLSFRN